jgi:hypothetical protein
MPTKNTLEILRALDDAGPQTPGELCNTLRCKQSDLYPAYTEVLEAGDAEGTGAAAYADQRQAEGPIGITDAGREKLRQPGG